MLKGDYSYKTLSKQNTWKLNAIQRSQSNELSLTLSFIASLAWSATLLTISRAARNIDECQFMYLKYCTYQKLIKYHKLVTYGHK